jgi:hypothetical protein
VYVNDDGGYESVLFRTEDDDGDEYWVVSSEMERRWDCAPNGHAFGGGCHGGDPTDCNWKEWVERGGDRHWIHSGVAVSQALSPAYASLVVKPDMQEGGWPSGLVLGASGAGLALVVVGAAVVVRSRRQRADRAAPLPVAVDDSDAQEDAGSDADESETETLHP